MPQVIPYIPQRITVHLGAPSSDAANVTVNFADYVKNVASSEIYPTWEEAALRANILAIVSFALNRVYTEFYRSRGYSFDITNSTAYDQFFVNGRSYFTNVARLVDELFDDYLRRPGFVEPLAAKFCNGTTVTCEGLSQWGSQNLARQGYDTVRILRSYYGNVEIVNNAPIRGITTSYPGTPLRRGTTGPSVVIVQVELNRISQNYPAIPKIPLVDGIFGAQTEAAVRRAAVFEELKVELHVLVEPLLARLRLHAPFGLAEHALHVTEAERPRLAREARRAHARHLQRHVGAHGQKVAARVEELEGRAGHTAARAHDVHDLQRRRLDGQVAARREACLHVASDALAHARLVG